MPSPVGRGARSVPSGTTRPGRRRPGPTNRAFHGRLNDSPPARNKAVNAASAPPDPDAPTADASQRLSAVLRDSYDAITVLSFDGTIKAWNRGADRIYGYLEWEALGHNIGMICPRGERARMLKRLKAVARGRSLPPFESRHVAKDGRLLDIWLTLNPLRDNRGRPVAAAATARDITAQKRAEAALRASEERNRSLVQTIVDTAVDGIIITNERGIIQNINPAAQRIFGYRADDVVGRNVKLLMPPPYRRPHTRSMRRYLRTGERRIIGILRELEGLRRDGRVIPIEVSVSETMIDGRRTFTGFVRDLTQRKKAEHSIRRLQRELIAAADAEQRRIGQELHDQLGSMLTGVSMLTEALQRRLERLGLPECETAAQLGSQVREAHAEARRVARGLVPLVVEIYGLVPSLQELAERVDAREGIRCRFRKRGTVRIEDKPVALTLYRIAQEATTNAARHARARSVDIRLSANRSGTLLEIRDDGVGLDGSKPRDEGLGLRTMRYRAGLIGATIDIVAAKPRGTLVRCTLSNHNTVGHEHGTKQERAST